MNSTPRIEDLVRMARDGDRQAFEDLVARSREPLDRFVRLRLGSHLRGEVQIEDVIQATISRALESIDRLRWQGDDSPRRWLQGIAENVILKLARSQRRSPLLYVEADRPSEDVSPSRSLRRDERFDRLEEALDRLSEDHRAVIVLARIKGLRVPEIARRMGRSPNAVVHLSYAVICERLDESEVAKRGAILNGRSRRHAAANRGGTIAHRRPRLFFEIPRQHLSSRPLRQMR